MRKMAPPPHVFRFPTVSPAPPPYTTFRKALRVFVVQASRLHVQPGRLPHKNPGSTFVGHASRVPGAWPEFKIEN